MSTVTRRRIARISIWICVITAVFAAVAFTVAPHRFGPAALLRTDIPAVIAIIGFRFYLRGSRSPVLPPPPLSQCPYDNCHHNHPDGGSP